jgi:hypothetical protein
MSLLGLIVAQFPRAPFIVSAAMASDVRSLE